jgi:hypothetical protein
MTLKKYFSFDSPTILRQKIFFLKKCSISPQTKVTPSLEPRNGESHISH